MADIRVGQLPDAPANLPADTKLLMYSASHPNKEMLAALGQVRDGLVDEDSEQELENKTLGTGSVAGTEEAPIPGHFSQVGIGDNGSRVTFWKRVRAPLAVPIIGAGDGAQIQVTVPGAAIANMVVASLSDAWLPGIIMQARMTGAGEATIYLYNVSGAATEARNIDVDILVLRMVG